MPGGAGLLRLRGEAAARGEKRTRGDWAARAPRGPSPAVAGRHVTRRRLPARWTLEAKMAAELVEAKVSELCPPPHRRGPGRPGRAPSGVDRERHGLGPGPSRESRGGGAPGPPLLPPPLFFYLRGCPAPVSGPVRSPRRTPGLARPGSQPLGAARPWACPLGCRAGPRPSPQLIPSD